MGESAETLVVTGQGGYQKPLMRMPAVATRLDVSLARVYELARGGRLPVTRLGRELRVDAEALERWIASGGQSLAK